MGIEGYRDLLVWQKAMDLVTEVYAVTRSLPRDEQYGLTAQLRRAAMSIPANIAEGHGRRGPGEFIRFLCLANGSLQELETHLTVAKRLAVLELAVIHVLLARCSELGRMLVALTRSLERRRATTGGKPSG